MKFELNNDEYNGLIIEIAERMKDIVYMQAMDQARKVVDEYVGCIIHSEDTIDITYKITMCCGDFIQILGGKRRKKN